MNGVRDATAKALTQPLLAGPAPISMRRAVLRANKADRPVTGKALGLFEAKFEAPSKEALTKGLDELSK